jgi:hypothetical protein
MAKRLRLENLVVTAVYTHKQSSIELIPTRADLCVQCELECH